MNETTPGAANPGQPAADFPPKTCEIDQLVTHAKLVEAALAGCKTQQRRNGIYAYPGEKFQLGEVEFVVADLRRETLGQMTEADARAEGYPSLEMYKDLILRMHKGMDWDGNSKVWVHEFVRVRSHRD
jgi:hypothetical protein